MIEARRLHAAAGAGLRLVGALGASTPPPAPGFGSSAPKGALPAVPPRPLPAAANASPAEAQGIFFKII